MGLHIEFLAWYGDKALKAELSQVMGTGDGIHVHLYINHYYRGTFFKRQSEWVVPDQLTGDDASILIDMIEESLKR